MSNVLITGINYWPEQTGIGPYTTQLAEHLADVGHSVTVITGVPHYPQWAVDPRYSKGPRDETRAGVRIIRRSHYIPRRQSASRRMFYEATFFAGGLVARSRVTPAFVIGVTPSLSGAALARYFAWHFRVPYGVVVQDLMGPAAAQSGLRVGKAVRGMAHVAERLVLAPANAIAAVSESFMPYLLALGISRGRLVHLPNWTHLSPSIRDRGDTRRRLGWADESQIVLHSGNMGLKQGLEQVVDAAQIAAHRGDPIRFVLMGDGSQRSLLTERARGLANVSFLPVQPDDVFADTLASADVLLLSERASVVDMSLPSKLTSYFAAGRPVVAAVLPSGATAREVTRSGGGLVVAAGYPDELLGALQRLRSEPAVAIRLGETGRAYAEGVLGREGAFRRIDGFVERVRADALPVVATGMKTA